MRKIANIVLNDFKNDSRVWKVSNTLSSFGYLPLVVAMHSDGLQVNECVGGVVVERVKLTTRPWPKWKPIQLLKYVEFLMRACWRLRKYKIFHCNDLNALPVGLIIKLFNKNVKVIYDCHEYETEINGLKGAEKLAKKLFERLLIRFVDCIITVSDSIANEYARIYSITKPRLVLNCPSYIEQRKHDLFRENLGIAAEQTIFLYQGGLSKGRGIELLLAAFSGLETGQNVLVCMGYGPLESLVRKKASESSTIFFHPSVAPHVLLTYTSSADYGILFYEDTCLNHRYCSPNKIFEYLMAGLPVLTSNLYEIKCLVENEGVGIVAEENTIEGFRQAITNSLNQDYSSKLKNVIGTRKKYCWEEQEKVLKEIYDAL